MSKTDNRTEKTAVLPPDDVIIELYFACDEAAITESDRKYGA